MSLECDLICIVKSELEKNAFGQPGKSHLKLKHKTSVIYLYVCMYVIYCTCIIPSSVFVILQVRFQTKAIFANDKAETATELTALVQMSHFVTHHLNFASVSCTALITYEFFHGMRIHMMTQSFLKSQIKC